MKAFEAGFREHEVPVWEDLRARGLLIGATLSRLDISSRPVPDAVQYPVTAIFATGEGHQPTTTIPGSRPGTRSPTPTRSATPWHSAARRSWRWGSRWTPRADMARDSRFGHPVTETTNVGRRRSPQRKQEADPRATASVGCGCERPAH